MQDWLFLETLLKADQLISIIVLRILVFYAHRQLVIKTSYATSHLLLNLKRLYQFPSVLLYFSTTRKKLANLPDGRCITIIYGICLMGPFLEYHPFIIQSEFRAPQNHSVYIALFKAKVFYEYFYSSHCGSILYGRLNLHVFMFNN